MRPTFVPQMHEHICTADDVKVGGGSVRGVKYFAYCVRHFFDLRTTVRLVFLFASCMQHNTDEVLPQ